MARARRVLSRGAAIASTLALGGDPRARTLSCSLEHRRFLLRGERATAYGPIMSAVMPKLGSHRLATEYL